VRWFTMSCSRGLKRVLGKESFSTWEIMSASSSAGGGGDKAWLRAGGGHGAGREASEVGAGAGRDGTMRYLLRID
jgi:hypothetical protein